MRTIIFRVLSGLMALGAGCALALSPGLTLQHYLLLGGGLLFFGSFALLGQGAADTLLNLYSRVHTAWLIGTLVGLMVLMLAVAVLYLFGK